MVLKVTAFPYELGLQSLRVSGKVELWSSVQAVIATMAPEPVCFDQQREDAPLITISLNIK